MKIQRTALDVLELLAAEPQPLAAHEMIPETREEKIARLEASGELDPECLGCKEFYAHPDVSPFAPRHKAKTGCESGGEPHCTCDSCF